MFDKINKTYLDKEVMEQMQDFFAEENFIQLNVFLDQDNNLIKKKILSQEFNEKYNPLKYKFSELNEKENYDLNIIKMIEFFKSKSFLEFVEEITQIELNFKDLKIKKYSQSDFTLLHDDQEREDEIVVIFDLSDDWQETFGGILTYVTKEQEIFYLSPIFNSLIILYKPESVMKYLKYINNHAKNKNILRFEIKFDLE